LAAEQEIVKQEEIPKLPTSANAVAEDKDKLIEVHAGHNKKYVEVADTNCSVKVNGQVNNALATDREAPKSKKFDQLYATETVEKDITSALNVEIAFKSFATQKRDNINQARFAKAPKSAKDKEMRLNDLKNFAGHFKLHTPIPVDLVAIIARNPLKQKKLQEKAKRNAEAANANPSKSTNLVTPAKARYVFSEHSFSSCWICESLGARSVSTSLA
jgi:hypothetical protein